MFYFYLDDLYFKCVPSPVFTANGNSFTSGQMIYYYFWLYAFNKPYTTYTYPTYIITQPVTSQYVQYNINIITYS